MSTEFPRGYVSAGGRITKAANKLKGKQVSTGDNSQTRGYIKKIVIIIIIAIAAVAGILALYFKPWEKPSQNVQVEAGDIGYVEAFENPDENNNAQVKFAGEVIADSQNNQGLTSVSVLVDGRYFILATCLDESSSIAFKKGDKVFIDGVLSQIVMVPADGGQTFSGLNVVADTIEKQ